MRPIIYIHYDIAIIRDILNLLYLVKLQLIFCTSYWTVVASLVLKWPPPMWMSYHTVTVPPFPCGVRRPGITVLTSWLGHWDLWLRSLQTRSLGEGGCIWQVLGGFTPCYFWQPSSNQQPPKGPGSCSPLCSDLTTTVPRPSQLIILEPYCFCSQIVGNDPWVSARLNRGCMGSHSDCVVDS